LHTENNNDDQHCGQLLTDVLQPEVEAISVLDGLDALGLHHQVLADQLVGGGDLVFLQDRNSGSTNTGDLNKRQFTGADVDREVIRRMTTASSI
jgi:hypothetical protein